MRIWLCVALRLIVYHIFEWRGCGYLLSHSFLTPSRICNIVTKYPLTEVVARAITLWILLFWSEELARSTIKVKHENHRHQMHVWPCSYSFIQVRLVRLIGIQKKEGVAERLKYKDMVLYNPLIISIQLSTKRPENAWIRRRRNSGTDTCGRRRKEGRRERKRCWWVLIVVTDTHN